MYSVWPMRHEGKPFLVMKSIIPASGHAPSPLPMTPGTTPAIINQILGRESRRRGSTWVHGEAETLRPVEIHTALPELRALYLVTQLLSVVFGCLQLTGPHCCSPLCSFPFVTSLLHKPSQVFPQGDAKQALAAPRVVPRPPPAASPGVTSEMQNLTPMEQGFVL